MLSIYVISMIVVRTEISQRNRDDMPQIMTRASRTARHAAKSVNSENEKWLAALLVAEGVLPLEVEEPVDDPEVEDGEVLNAVLEVTDPVAVAEDFVRVVVNKALVCVKPAPATSDVLPVEIAVTLPPLPLP
jgi:hypothetical protein